MLLGFGTAVVGAALSIPLLRVALHPLLSTTTRTDWSDIGKMDEFASLSAPVKKLITVEQRDGWRLLFEAISPLAPEDLQKTVVIRGEPHSVLQAINRQLTHYAGHVGQIVYLAKHFAGARWKTLSVPRGRSREFDVTKGGSSYRPGQKEVP